MKEGGTSLNKTFREYNLAFKGLNMILNISLNFFVVTTVAIYIYTGFTYQSQPRKITKEEMEEV